MEKTRTLTISGGFIIVVAVLGVILYRQVDRSPAVPLSGTGNASSSSMAASGAVASSDYVYDPLNDPELEGSPAYEAAEQESLRNVERARAIAEAFVFEGIPEDYEELCPDGGGFCFWHPPSWGRASWRDMKECIGRDDLIGLVGHFDDKGESYYFGAHAYSYADSDECKTAGRGGSVLDGLPRASVADTADTVIRSGSGAEIALWYGNEVGWLTHDYDMAFAAPTGHPLVTRIAFIGPTSSDPDLTQEEIEEFLTVAHSYRTVEFSQD